MKNLKERFLGNPWLWWSKISEIINWNSDCDSRNIAYSGKSIYLKMHLGLFLFIQNDFLRYIAHGIMSYIITDKMHWESR